MPTPTNNFNVDARAIAAFAKVAVTPTQCVHYVTERVLIARVNRVLAKEGRRLKVSPCRSRWFNDLGRFYVVNDCNNIEATHIDLEDWARGYRVLRTAERLAN